jgi:hypothetical protein
MALRIYGNSHNERRETSRSILAFSKWSLKNVQRPRSYKGDMVLFSNKNRYRREKNRNDTQSGALMKLRLNLACKFHTEFSQFQQYGKVNTNPPNSYSWPQS